MKDEFHAIIVDKSQKNNSIFEDLNIIGKEVSGDWVLYKISVSEKDLKDTINKIQRNMIDDTWYFHFYNDDGSRLIIVFKGKIFKTDNSKENWKEAIEYGESLCIPAEQLDFSPNTFAEESY